MTARHSFVPVTLFTLLRVVLSPSAVSAQQIWALEDQPHYRPFKGEPRAAQINITALALSDEFPFQQKPGRRRIWDISLGKEIPVFGLYTEAKAQTLGEGAGWWGIFVPIGFHMVEDFKDDSAPIINTDYRFAVSLKYLRGLGNGWGMGFKVEPVGHESTHLGDEFTLAASKNDPDFFRINVSYEYWDVAWYAQKETDRGTWRFQAGVIGLWGDNGFYTFDFSETGGREVTPSNRSLEPYFDVERLSRTGWLGGWNWFLSLDVRSRIVFDYFRADPDIKEDRQLTSNLMIGLRDIGRDVGIIDFFVRLYHGVNRNGQFRSERGYFLLGIGFHVGV